MTAASPTATCPKCASTSLQAVPVERKSLGMAVLAEVALGTAAGVAAGGDTVIQVLCLNCGCTYIPGTGQERQLRALSGQLGEQAKFDAERRWKAAEKADESLRTWERRERAKAPLVLIPVGVVFALLYLFSR